MSSSSTIKASVVRTACHCLRSSKTTTSSRFDLGHDIRVISILLAKDFFGDNLNLCTSNRCLHQVDKHLNNPDALHGDTSTDCKHALIIRSKSGSKGQSAHLKCLSNPEPDRQVKAGLSPSKDPRNGSQRINAGSCLTLGRSTSNVHASKLTYGSTLLEEINEACVFPHHIPVRIARYL